MKGEYVQLEGSGDEVEHEEDKNIVNSGRSAAEKRIRFKKADSHTWLLESTDAPVDDEDTMLLGKEAVSDFSWLLYALVYVEGVGTLFPWNAFITVTSYFSNKLSNSSFSGNFENYFSFCFQFFNIAFLIVDVYHGAKIPTKYRVGIPLFAQLIIFGLMAAFVKIDTSENVFFGVTMCLVAVSGTATAFVQGGLFSLCAIMRSKYIQAFMSGQALGGLIVATLNVITLSAGNNPDTSAFAFFLISVAVVAFCLGAFIYLLRSPYVHHRELESHHARRLSMDAISADSNASGVHNWGMVKEAIKKVKFMALMVLLVFTATLSVFPGITDRIVSFYSNDTSKGWGKYFIPVGCFVLFNLGDLIGRSLSLWKQFPSFKNYKLISFPVSARFIIVVLYLFCNIDFNDGNDAVKNYVPIVFKSDAFPIIFMLLLSISNGYLANLCMEYGPRLVDPHLTAISGSFMALALTVGLLLGTLVNFAFKGLMCQCNPFTG
eukprot:m.16163 g.16163  ORF g.16163 m.16163 type:complete len:490 (-) comp7962_c0_seq1:150-1619(-)